METIAFRNAVVFLDGSVSTVTGSIVGQFRKTYENIGTTITWLATEPESVPDKNRNEAEVNFFVGLVTSLPASVSLLPSPW